MLLLEKEKLGFFSLIQLQRSRWRKRTRLKVNVQALLSSFCFCFYGDVSEQGLERERQLCKWDMPVKIRCLFTVHALMKVLKVAPSL